jgi:hypothetical protein
MNKNLLLAVLATLALAQGAVLLVTRPEPSPPAPVLVRNPVTGRVVQDAPLPPEVVWSAERLPASGPASASPAEAVTEVDLRPLASLEMSTDFARSVRAAKAAGVDETLLAHAVVSQFHRQAERLVTTGNYEEMERKRAVARERAVTELLGASTWRGWLRSDYLMTRDLWGSGLSDAEVDAKLAER